MSPLDGITEAAPGLRLQSLCGDLLRRRLRLWRVDVVRLRLSPLLLLRGELGLDLL
jgi:hypothetical protein